MPSNKRQIIEQGKFTYSPLGKTFERAKNDWRARRKTNKGTWKLKKRKKQKTKKEKKNLRHR